MDIYVVQPGDTIYSIADRYGVNADQLVKDNELPRPDLLIPGESIVITYPTQTYTVQDGDTIEVNATTINSIAQISTSKGITGTGIWNVMNYFAQMWLVINSQYQIIKLLPEI
jgi:spore germination protein YaaH